ncbi:MAG TPA: glutathione peroxidase, partial [bacterium]|nr:glutathione peroxidase [bacterium]
LNGWNEKAPSWNFCKYLIDENGELIGYYNSSVNPLSDEIINKL